MWVAYAQPPVPIYSVPRVSRRKAKKNAQAAAAAAAAAAASSDLSPDSSSQRSSEQQSPTAPMRLNTQNLTELLEPAVDGPPSPERIRALSKQMKRGSVMDRHQSHQTTSSGSSSLRSLASADRPSWEQALEGISLSRRSSQRSTSSSMPSRDRPESVQIFGKTIFNRRGKLKRESSATGSSGSSMYSTDAPFDTVTSPPTSANKESFIPAILNRRRTLKAESAEESAALRKYQISGPYNFQHVTHTQRDHLPNLQRTNRVALQSELAALRSSQSPTKGSLQGIQAEDLHFANFSSEALPVDEEEDTVAASFGPLARVPEKSPRRLITHTRSQEQLRAPPPRPPRSPVEPTFVPPVPPPRISSRTSTQFDEIDPLASGIFGRPQTSGGFRRPQPLALDMDGISPPATSHGFAAQQSDMSEQRFSRLFVAPDDANWPLTCPINHSFEAALPDVPEEEEQCVLARRSRLSVRSNNSSLRGSQSVPLLRQLVQSQATTARPPSGESVTLGRFDLFAAQTALREGLENEDGGVEILPRDSWEEVIDYCYDHEAEADCDYAWDRPSLDLTRDDSTVTPPAEDDIRHFRSSSQVLPAMLTPGGFDVPALSPASQISSATMQEAVTPTAPAMSTKSPTRSNFSLPRKDGRQAPRFLHVRTTSHASSFKESQGFTLSPSLLIPGDYHQELLSHQAELRENDEFVGKSPYEEPTLTLSTSNLFVQSRSSASTTGSNDSSRSGSERHISTASTATDYTRLTMSTSSINMEDLVTKEPVPSFVDHDDVTEPTHTRSGSKASPMAVLLESETLGSPLRRDLNRGSDTNLSSKRRDSLHTRRGRARTTSLSTPPPPGQYALFPQINMTGPRI